MVKHPEQHEQRASHDASEGKRQRMSGSRPHLPTRPCQRNLRSTTWLAASRHATQLRFSVYYRPTIDFMNSRITVNDINHHPISLYWTKRSVRDGVDAQAGHLTDIDFDLRRPRRCKVTVNSLDRPARMIDHAPRHTIDDDARHEWSMCPRNP